MLSNPLQYSPQSLSLPFAGLQAAGWPQMGAALGQPGAYNGTAQFGQDSAQAGFGQFAANPYLQSQWQNPAHNPFPGSPFLGSIAGHAGAAIPGQIPAHHIVPVLGQLAHHIAVQGAVTQQIGIAVHQLALQLASQVLQGQALQGQGLQGHGLQGHGLQGHGLQGHGLQGYPFSGPQSVGPQSFGPQGFGPQTFGPQSFGLSGQGTYGGLGPQAQGWNQAWGGRQQTIQ